MKQHDFLREHCVSIAGISHFCRSESLRNDLQDSTMDSELRTRGESHKGCANIEGREWRKGICAKTRPRKSVHKRLMWKRKWRRYKVAYMNRKVKFVMRNRWKKKEDLLRTVNWLKKKIAALSAEKRRTDRSGWPTGLSVAPSDFAGRFSQRGPKWATRATRVKATRTIWTVFVSTFTQIFRLGEFRYFRKAALITGLAEGLYNNIGREQCLSETTTMI